MPLTGTTATATVPFRNNVLTLVASLWVSLAGAGTQYLPRGSILGLGMVLSVAAAAVTENLVRRRKSAEVLYTQQRRASETLQRSLLPKRLPAVAGWEFAARDVPATKGADIGGDWYRVVEVNDHRFAVVVGDVSGHDLAAAGVMAALRYTIHTLAKLGIPPGEILARTAPELDVVTDDHFATVLVVMVETGMQELTVASAGHPAPLLVQDGHARYLKVSPAVPLGVPGPPPEPITVHFPPGSTLVAFTDGLIEPRAVPRGWVGTAGRGGGQPGSARRAHHPPGGGAHQRRSRRRHRHPGHPLLHPRSQPPSPRLVAVERCWRQPASSRNLDQPAGVARRDGTVLPPSSGRARIAEGRPPERQPPSEFVLVVVGTKRVADTEWRRK